MKNLLPDLGLGLDSASRIHPYLNCLIVSGNFWHVPELCFGLYILGQTPLSAASQSWVEVVGLDLPLPGK